MAPATPTEPFPISHIAGRYLLFDVETVSHARRTHNICGVLIGTIPNLSQQNVFLGLPCELMPEEARVLVERGHAYIVDDVEAHRKGFMEMSREERLRYLRDMDEQGMEKAREAKMKVEERSRKALREKGLEVREEKAENGEGKVDEVEVNETLFDSTPKAVAPVSKKKLDPQYITPVTSYPPLAHPPVEKALPLPEVPRSYPLYRYMHSKGYFSMPGLRFGCHYSMYPGDPLRFHSHFLATGLDWDEEFDLLDIIGGGRLGTGVKKGYLIGGEDPSVKESNGESEDDQGAEPVRAFCIEWAGM